VGSPGMDDRCTTILLLYTRYPLYHHRMPGRTSLLLYTTLLLLRRSVTR